MQLSHLAHLRHQPWAIVMPQLKGFIEQMNAVAAMMAKGIGPMEKYTRAIQGERVLETEVGAGGAAVLSLSGVLLESVPWYCHAMGLDVTDLSEARSIVDELTRDDRCTALVLNINSPGGTTAGTGELVSALLRFKAAGKSLTVQAQGMLCSAAYWIASVADSISASATTIIGSIGTYVVLADTSEANEKAGVNLVLVSTGPHKGLGADDRVTPEMVAQWQAIVNAINASFLAGVAAGRNFSDAQIQALATGDIWLGRAALTNGLIDAIADDNQADAPADPTPTPDPVTDPTPPAVDDPADDKPEQSGNSTVKITAQALVAILTSLAASPTAVADMAFVNERATAGDDEAAIRAGLAARQSTALSEKVTALGARITALEGDLKAEKDAHGKTQDELKAMQTKHGRLTAFAKGGSKDPGAEDPANGSKPSPLSHAEFSKLDGKKQAAYINAGGVMPEAGV